MMLRFDLRDVGRGLVRDRLYSAIVIATLALTIGSTTAVYSIVDGVLFKPLDYRDPGRLVALREVWREFSTEYPTLPVNEQHFEYWRSHAASFASMAQYIDFPETMTGAGEAVQITVVEASSAIFDVLGVQPALGRAFGRDDERAGAPAVAMISDTLWKERFGGEATVVGRTITIDGKPRTIVGVLPAGIRLPAHGNLTSKMDAFVPISLPPDVGWVGDHNVSAIARLRPGVTVEQAGAELDVMQGQVSAIASKEGHESVTLAGSLAPLTESVVGKSRRGLLLLLGAILSVLLITSANLANLSLTRAIGALRQSAVRAALGASRARLIGRAVLEQTILALCGGALGLAVAWAALRVFVRTAPIDLPRVSDVALDGRVLAFAALISIATGIVVAILPAWRVARGQLESILRAGSQSLAGDRRGSRTRATLLSIQVALAVTLLAVTGLLTVSFVRLLRVDKGFSSDRVLALGIDLPASRYAERAARDATYDRILDAVRALPGVERATPTSMLPLAGEGQVNTILPEGSTLPRTEQPSANFRFVSPDFFQTLGLRIVRGRPFTNDERWKDRALPVLVSASTAARLWPDRDALGLRFSRGIPQEQGFQVVGIVADARTTSLERTPPLMVYVPFWWRSRTSTSLLIKMRGDAMSLAPAVRRAVQAIDPEIAVGQVRALDDLVEASLAGRRYQMRLFVAFGAMALFIATLGVYAVTGYGISRRRREMNIRMALGATAAQVFGLVVREGLVPIAAGVAIGVAAAIGAGSVVAALLFDVSARNPVVIGGVSGLVAAAGMAATLTAARGALAVDPAAALREE